MSLLPWHGGLSGSIPLVINTPENLLITSGVLQSVIPTHLTLSSTLNIVTNIALITTMPFIMLLLRLSSNRVMNFKTLRNNAKLTKGYTVVQDAERMQLPEKNLSDKLNNSFIIQVIISILGLWYLVWHFFNKGFDLNLNIMIFVFIVVGMILHKTPIRYTIAIKRSCGNVSGIILQFPFYTGIMGIMAHTALGAYIAKSISGFATITTFPFIAFLIGGLLNIFVPSGGGEWAVIGTTIVDASKNIGAELPPGELNSFISRICMAVAYGDSCTNMIQPFWTLAFFPIISNGVKCSQRI